MAKKKKSNIADSDDDDFAPPANTGKAATTTKKESVKVNVHEIAADGTRKITVGSREIILDADTTRISTDFFIDPETNMKKTVNVNGLYLLSHVNRRPIYLHEYIMKYHEDAEQIKEAAIEKWHSTNLCIGHMNGNADNDNVGNLQWIPCELNANMKRTNPIKRGKSWYSKVKVQGDQVVSKYVPTEALARVLGDGLKLKMTRDHVMTIKFKDTDGNDLDPVTLAETRNTVAQHWCNVIHDYSSFRGKDGAYIPIYDTQQTLLDFCETQKKSEMPVSHRDAIIKALAPDNEYITFHSVASFERSKLASNADLREQVHNIRTAIKRSGFIEENEVIVYYRGSTAGTEIFFMCDVQYFKDALKNDKPTLGLRLVPSKPMGYVYFSSSFPQLDLHIDITGRYQMNAVDRLVVDHLNGVSIDDRSRNLKVGTSADNNSNRWNNGPTDDSTASHETLTHVKFADDDKENLYPAGKRFRI